MQRSICSVINQRAILSNTYPAMCQTTKTMHSFGMTFQSINQTSIAPISPVKPGSLAQQPNQFSTAKSRKQFRDMNRPWGVTVSVGKRPNQRDVSSDIS